MEIHKQIRDKVALSQWRTVPYRNGGSPTQTFNEIVTDSFTKVQQSARSASHCQLEEMYHPNVGRLRRSHTYSALAPTNGMKYQNRASSLINDLRPFNAYKTKRGEWKTAKERPQHQMKFRWGPPHNIPSLAALPMMPTYRRQYAVPSDPTRMENFATYWEARAKGLDYCEPFLHEPERDTYEIEERRRYERMHVASHFVPSQPTARHGRQLMLTAY